MRLLIFVSAFALLDCEPSVRCDPGQRYELGSCLPLARSADAGSQDASVDDSGADDAGTTPTASCKPGPGNYKGFGDACKKDSDCSSCTAPACATAPINMCSRVNCQGDPQACPPNWQCTDISLYSPDPAVTHICLKM